ncbi:MAG: MXAN_6640 family putative metalloprotease [Chloroflexota bacterium]
MRRFISISGFILLTLAGFSVIRADDQTYTGALNADDPTFSTTFNLNRDESVYITADSTSGDLDTYLSLENADSVVVAENDDRDYNQLNSALGYTASQSGAFTITLSRAVDDSSGDYELKIVIGDASVLDNLDTQPAEITLSGPALTMDTAHFRIHYTLVGTDAVKKDYVYQVAKTMEDVWHKQVVEMKWPAPPSDGHSGGDARMDVYLLDTLDDDGYGAMGSARPGYQYGDNPNTAAVEHYASSTLLRLDNDFQELASEDDPINLMRATAAHEFHHAIQHGYDIDDLAWYAESTSVWMETQTYPKNQDATGYIDYNYRYPELCLGTQSDPEEGMMMYGEWLLIQSLVDAHGQKVIYKLWNDIAQYDGFDALDHTLAFFDDSIPNALARYRIQNIVRDYKFAPEFGGAVLWMSNNIGGTGRIDGYGVQELGANYIGFNPPKGTYRVNLVDNDSLELWAVGIKGDTASAIPLGHGGTISNQGYDHEYLMVFNPATPSDIDNCTYANYNLDVSPSNAALAPVIQTWDAKYFLPLKTQSD